MQHILGFLILAVRNVNYSHSVLQSIISDKNFLIEFYPMHVQINYLAIDLVEAILMVIGRIITNFQYKVKQKVTS